MKHQRQDLMKSNKKLNSKGKLLYPIIFSLPILGIPAGYASSIGEPNHERSQVWFLDKQVTYLPYLQVSGTKFFHGSSSWATGLDLFFPLWQQELNKLLYSSLRVYDRSGPSFECNLHLGYREILQDKILLGGYLAFDRRRADNDKCFNQLVFGTGNWWGKVFIGGNYYQPIGKKFSITGLHREVGGQIKYNNEFITVEELYDLMRGNESKAARGFDAELGYEFVPGLVGYAGGYYFKATGLPEVTGPRVSLSYNLLNREGKGWLKGIGVEGLGVEFGVQHDTPRGWMGYANVKLKLGLAGTNSRLEGLSRHMVDLPRRDVDIVVVDNVVTLKNLGPVLDEKGRQKVMVKLRSNKLSVATVGRSKIDLKKEWFSGKRVLVELIGDKKLSNGGKGLSQAVESINKLVRDNASIEFGPKLRSALDRFARWEKELASTPSNLVEVPNGKQLLRQWYNSKTLEEPSWARWVYNLFNGNIFYGVDSIENLEAIETELKQNKNYINQQLKKFGKEKTERFSKLDKEEQRLQKQYEQLGKQTEQLKEQRKQLDAKLWSNNLWSGGLLMDNKSYEKNRNYMLREQYYTISIAESVKIEMNSIKKQQGTINNQRLEYNNEEQRYRDNLSTLDSHLSMLKQRKEKIASAEKAVKKLDDDEILLNM